MAGGKIKILLPTLFHFACFLIQRKLSVCSPGEKMFRQEIYPKVSTDAGTLIPYIRQFVM